MIIYIQITSESSLPKISTYSPFKAVVIVEDQVTIERQNEMSKWLVDQGCFYMMAWGRDCSSWDDSVDFANLENFNFEEVPEDEFVMTTWHDDELMDEVFWFSKYCAYHSVIELQHTVIIHI